MSTTTCVSRLTKAPRIPPASSSLFSVLRVDLAKRCLRHQSCGYNILLIDADFTTKSLTNLIFSGRKVSIENRTFYYKDLLGIDDVKVEDWLKGVFDDTHILPY